MWSTRYHCTHNLHVLFPNAEGGSDKTQVVIRTARSKLQFSSQMSLVYVTLVTTVLNLLLPAHLRMILDRYRSFSGPILMHIIFIVWAILLTLQFSVLLSGTLSD
jgi:hypothetical protein